MESEIYQNAARCKKCKDIIHSRSVHDYKKCSCGAIMVDGGNEYFRSGGSAPGYRENLCLSEDSSIKEIREKLLWGTRGKNGDEPMQSVLIKDCSTKHLMNIIRHCKDANRLHLSVVLDVLTRRAKEFDKFWDEIRPKRKREGEQFIDLTAALLNEMG